MSAAAGPELARAWGWVAHLREGGTDPWQEWSGPAADPSGRVLPGAQQLEVLRRLNALGEVPAALAERVLAGSAPGRGQPDLELVGATRETRFGPRPVDPAQVPTGELLRVAAGLLAEDVVAAGVAPDPRPGRPRPWRRAYRLAGDPELTQPVQRRLLALGRPPGGRGASVVVLADDLATVLADLWTHRAFTRGVRAWEGWLRRLEQRDELPVAADPVRAARLATGGAGRTRVHVVLDRAALPGLVGTRRPLPGPERPAAHVPELGRWVASYLGLHVPAPTAVALARTTLRPRLAADPGPRLQLPPARRAWVRARAEGLAEDLSRSGYAVHGDPAALVPPETHPGVVLPAPVRRESALDLALRALRGGPTGQTSTSEEGA